MHKSSSKSQLKDILLESYFTDGETGEKQKG